LERNLSIVLTTDGSQTIRNDITGDTYHSIHGAIQESQHVFIKNGLEYFTQTFPKEKINILEVGLGTGLNALLTFQLARTLNLKVEYVALEAYPLSSELYSQLNYGSHNDILIQFHECEWDLPVCISQDFTFTKHQTRIESIELEEKKFDVVYYDAFAPNSQPEMWTPDLFNKLIVWMNIPSVLTTYCAKGEVKRSMRSAGYNIEKLQGPPGKREMIRANKSDQSK
jgi:tRNA U34 5-methylaminomethyl-2-thiouridine-forming methyltransferase MnmC